MKRIDWRYLLICLMLACVPLQGMAALGLLSCHTEPSQHAVMHIDAAGMQGEHVTQHDQHQLVDQVSSALDHAHAPCCTGVALLFSQLFLPNSSPCSRCNPALTTEFTSEYLDSLLRPPAQ